MTFDDDFVRLNLTVGPLNIPLAKLGLEWPPPEQLHLGSGGVANLRAVHEGDDMVGLLERISMSEITDEQRAKMTHVCRGAEYSYAEEV